MKIGVCTWIFGHHEHQRIADFCERYSFDGVDLFVDIKKVDPIKVSELYGSHNIEFYSLTPEKYSISSLEKNREALTYYKNLIDYAVAINAPAITCHEAVGRKSDTPSSLEWEILIDSCKAITEYAAPKSIEILFEPLNRNLVPYVNSARDVLRLCAAVDSPWFRIVLDSFHIHQENLSAVEEILLCDSLLGCYQISDSNRGGIGQGSIDFNSQFITLKDISFTGPLILEPALNLNGPSLSHRHTDLVKLHACLKSSIDYIRHFHWS